MKMVIVIIGLVIILSAAVLYGLSLTDTPPTASPTPMPTATPTPDDTIIINQPHEGAYISSPLKVTGKARGTWFFEASFPVVLTDKDGNILAQVPAQAQGEWMTTDWVAFEATLTFEHPTTGSVSPGYLILKKDNPSGLPEHDDSRTLSVFIQ